MNRLSLGPYFGVAFAEFVDHSLDPSPAGADDTVEGLAVHEWFTLGVRGTYRPL